ncbi:MULTISPECIES: hypothetical protein [Bacillus cereus group]|uniref:hypothetical protein n=1 Tax=Bacillus cereus group TaxID=86661 RepID=UPI000279CA9A|nr:MULTISPECIES: hypothetical protein [Bacillus cereus group]EJR57287.1 hypothetical protein IIO_04814 [Bacillus cereus VD115]KAB2363426.1 hypothetical protein F8517_28615 [Bacillus thuringiensis]MCU5130660.1 hypothetical protein [Bacillus cereus]MCU5527463.1 hypothetical protein [Bacillus cereus]MCU5542957.1 hypothetical protein [Bacillus cereus]
MGITNTRLKLDNAAIEEAIEALKEENECLRMEIDYLKKLKAFVQKEMELQPFLNEKVPRL